MEIALALVAILLSGGLLIVHLINQRERRHGEIVDLKDDLYDRYTALIQRLNSILLVHQMTRMVLRRFPDCDEKWDSIEKFATVVSDLEEVLESAKLTQVSLKGLDTKSGNRTSTLVSLQELVSRMKAMNSSVTTSEESAKDLLEYVEDTNQAEQDVDPNA